MILDRRMTRLYNCAHFVADAWEGETGHDIRPVLVGFLATREARRAMPRLAHDFVRIPVPVSPCVVLFRRVKATPHVGMFIRGRVLHLTDIGPIRQLLAVASLGYTSARFYAPR